MGILLVLEVFGHKLNVTEVIACLKGTLMWTHANPSAMFRYCTVQCQICWKRWITKPRTHLLETITVLTEFTLIRPIVYIFQPRLKQRTDSQTHVSICKAKQEAWLKMYLQNKKSDFVLFYLFRVNQLIHLKQKVRLTEQKGAGSSRGHSDSSR